MYYFTEKLSISMSKCSFILLFITSEIKFPVHAIYNILKNYIQFMIKVYTCFKIEKSNVTS